MICLLDGSGKACQTDLASLCELDALVPVSSPPSVLELSEGRAITLTHIPS